MVCDAGLSMCQMNKQKTQQIGNGSGSGGNGRGNGSGGPKKQVIGASSGSGQNYCLSINMFTSCDDTALIKEKIPDTLNVITVNGEIKVNKFIIKQYSEYIKINLKQQPNFDLIVQPHTQETVKQLMELLMCGEKFFIDRESASLVVDLAEQLNIKIEGMPFEKKDESYVKYVLRKKRTTKPQSPKKSPGILPLVDGRYKCDKCSKTFSQKNGLKNHINNVHIIKEKTVPCLLETCEKKFKSIVYRNIHLIQNHKIKSRDIETYEVKK